MGALLKWAGVVSTGGEAKVLIAGGRVLVNGRVENRCGCKIRVGDRVTVRDGPVLMVIGDGCGVPPSVVAARLS